MSAADKIPVAVVGATGYTGAELLRWLLGHPHVQVTRIYGHEKAGQPVARALPSLRGVIDGDVAAFDPADAAGCAQAAFCALPHGASAGVVEQLRAHGLPVFDLSADFRLSARAYGEWYGTHEAPKRLEEAVYGLVELHREALRQASLVAVPGCYPTSAILALAPLVRDELVDADRLLIDAKSGVSGAGRAPKQNTHLPEAAEGIRAYKTGGGHRHTPEIEQELSALAGRELRVTFTPHLVPMTRGLLATAYAPPTSTGVTAEACTDAARELYAGSPSVVVLDPGESPDTLWVRGSNRVYVSYTRDARTGHIVAQAALDNLVKGAAGQAVQCFNVAFGDPEGEGLQAVAMWP